MNLLKLLDGYKTILAGLAAFCGGLGMVIPAWMEGTFFGDATVEGYQMMVAGLTIWGFGGKLEKLKGS